MWYFKKKSNICQQSLKKEVYRLKIYMIYPGHSSSLPVFLVGFLGQVNSDFLHRKV